MAVAVGSDPVVTATDGMVGATVAAIVAVLLAGVTVVLVLRVVAVAPSIGEPVAFRPVPVIVLRGNVTLVLVASELPVVPPMEFPMFSMLPPVFPPVFPLLPILPPGMGTLGSTGGPKVGGYGVGGCWSGFHRKISQS